MKGIPPHTCKHKIEIGPDAEPIKQSKYRMNPTYAAQVKEEIDKLVKTIFIYPMNRSEWLSPIVIVLKKNGKLRVCVDCHKLNAMTKLDPFLLWFTDSILEIVAGYDIYSLMDGFMDYNQTRIALEDQLKACFITQWGAFAYRIMSFGLMSAPSTFQRATMEIFAEYLDKFMKMFLDDFSIYGSNT